jgi:TRAP transporter TAXI family solute receptor
MRRLFILGIFALFIPVVSLALAQKEIQLSIAAGGTGDVYYPMAGGIADILSRYIPHLKANAEVTAGSVTNCHLVGRGKADLALIMADMGWEAFQGKGKFGAKIPLRTVAVLYPSSMHVVTREGTGIARVADMRGRRISTGAPESGTEAKSLRILKAYGLDPDRDMERDRLGPSESASALKDRKIDAYFWDGDLPTASVTDLGATPGFKIKLIGHDDAISKMREKYGPLYVKGIVPAKTYPGQDEDVPIVVVWNLLVCNERMREDLVYEVVKVLFDHQSEFVSAHKEAKWLSLEPQIYGSPIPFHPGAIRYFTEKGRDIK